MYFVAIAMSPVGCWRKSYCAPDGPGIATCLLESRDARHDEVRRQSRRRAAPPRVSRSATRFDAAITALRVLTLLNGGFAVLRAMYRLLVPGSSDSCFGYCVAATFSDSPVAEKSNGDHARSGQDLLDGRVRVGVTLLDHDLVHVGRAEVRTRRVVRVAVQHDLLAGLVARDVVRPDVDLMLAVRRGRRLGVVLGRVALRDRGRQRERQHADEAERGGLAQVEHDRRRVRRLDAADVRAPWSGPS